MATQGLPRTKLEAWKYTKDGSKHVHKWERRLMPIGRGGTILYKWVQLKDRAGTGDQGESEPTQFVPEQTEAGTDSIAPRRLTRGKAADMGIVVESIAENSGASDGTRLAGNKRSEPDGGGGAPQTYSVS